MNVQSVLFPFALLAAYFFAGLKVQCQLVCPSIIAVGGQMLPLQLDACPRTLLIADHACMHTRLSPKPNDAYALNSYGFKLFGCCSMPCPHDHGCHNVQQQPFSHTSLADADCDKSHVALQDQMEVGRLFSSRTVTYWAL